MGAPSGVQEDNWSGPRVGWHRSTHRAGVGFLAVTAETWPCRAEAIDVMLGLSAWDSQRAACKAAVCSCRLVG